MGIRLASPLRVEPPCRYFGNCGGCQWQHLGYPAQLDWKRRILEELLVRVGKLEGVPIAPIIDPGAPWEYRARAQFKVIGGARPCIGFHQRETNRVVDIDRCPLLDPRLNALLHAMRHMKHPSFFSLFQRLREAWVALGTGTGEMLLSLFARVQDRGALRLVFHTLQAAVPGLRGVALLEGDPRQGPRLVDWAGSEVLQEQVGDLRFRIGGTAFFQVSGLAASRLTSLVLEEAKLAGTERVLELYCGAGTFTVPLAKARPGSRRDRDEPRGGRGRGNQPSRERVHGGAHHPGAGGAGIARLGRRGALESGGPRPAAAGLQPGGHRSLGGHAGGAGDLCVVRSEHARPRPWRARSCGVSVYETSSD